MIWPLLGGKSLQSMEIVVVLPKLRWGPANQISRSGRWKGNAFNGCLGSVAEGFGQVLYLYNSRYTHVAKQASRSYGGHCFPAPVINFNARENRQHWQWKYCLQKVTLKANSYQANALFDKAGGDFCRKQAKRDAGAVHAAPAEIQVLNSLEKLGWRLNAAKFIIWAVAINSPEGAGSGFDRAGVKNQFGLDHRFQVGFQRRFTFAIIAVQASLMNWSQSRPVHYSVY